MEQSESVLLNNLTPFPKKQYQITSQNRSKRSQIPASSLACSNQPKLSPQPIQTNGRGYSVGGTPAPKNSRQIAETIQPKGSREDFPVDFTASTQTCSPKRTTSSQRRSFRATSPATQPPQPAETDRERKETSDVTMCQRCRPITQCCHRAIDRQRQHRWHQQPSDPELGQHRLPKQTTSALSQTR
jgi:hypothetical protein